MELPQELITMDYLSTFGGMVLVVYLITKFFKSNIKKYAPDYGVRLFALFIAGLVQIFLLYTTNNLTVEAIGLGVFNSFLITLTAMGLYDFIDDPKALKY